MEFFVVVLIFITCMIALALLIYYCQEYRSPKYSFTDNQKDISAIALAIGVPGFQPGEYKTALPPPGFKPSYLQPSPPSPPRRFSISETPPAPYPPSTLPPPQTRSPPREYVQAVQAVQALSIPEYTSDDSSSSSEQIYFAPKTAAYSVAKRMSMSANVARRMSAATYSRDNRPSISADVAAFIMAKRMGRNWYRKNTNVAANNKIDETEDQQRKTGAVSIPIAEDSPVRSSDSNSVKQHKGVEHKSTSPISSGDVSARSSSSRNYEPEETKKRRSASPFIPTSVVAIHLRNKTGTGKPYMPLQNDSPYREEREQKPPKVERPVNPIVPRRSKRLSPKPTENHPLKFTNNSSLKQSEVFPPQEVETISVRKRIESDNLPPKQTSSDRLPLTASEIAYRSHSPTPLHTVEEEED